MKVILHKKTDGGVAVYPPNPEVLALMMGDGTDWSYQQKAWEISKFRLPTPDIDPPWDGFTESFATEWINALANGGLTESAALDLFARRVQARRGYTEYVIVDDSTLANEIRGDRYFRMAVVYDGASGVCDMSTARGIHMDCIRLERNKKLAKLDIPWMKALEAGDTSSQATITTQKQTLRDIPQTLDLTTDTPEELKAKWPSELPARE